MLEQMLTDPRLGIVSPGEAFVMVEREEYLSGHPERESVRTPGPWRDTVSIANTSQANEKLELSAAEPKKLSRRKSSQAAGMFI